MEHGVVCRAYPVMEHGIPVKSGLWRQTKCRAIFILCYLFASRSLNLYRGLVWVWEGWDWIGGRAFHSTDSSWDSFKSSIRTDYLASNVHMCKLLTCLSNQIFLSHYCGLSVSLLRFGGCRGDLLACPGPRFLGHSLCTLYHCVLLCTVLCTTVCHICELAGSWCPTDVPFRILCPKLVSWRILEATLWMSFTQNYLLPLCPWFWWFRLKKK